MIRDGDTGWQSLSYIEEQIEILNDSFAGTGFEFVLEGTSCYNNWYWMYNYPYDKHDESMKSYLRIGGATTLNIYSTSPREGLLGWATFPWEYRFSPKLDGVVINYMTAPDGDAFPYNMGFTLVHEVGHWLGKSPE